MQYLINVDWFQIFAIRNDAVLLEKGCFYAGKSRNDKGYVNQYLLDKSEEFHPLYSTSYAVKLRKFTLAHIFLHPRMSVLDPMAVSLKMSNRVLYASNWAWYLYDILEALSLTFKNITRVDVCCDFTHFINDLHPVTFIKRFLATESTEDSPMYVRDGSNKYFTIGEKVQMEDGFELLTEYLRFGTRNSGVCTYLYNKSKELRDKKSKPYIRKAWVDGGLIEDTEDAPDVYRLEFSITQKGTRIEDLSSREDIIQEQMRRRLYCKLVEIPFCRTLALEDFKSAEYVEAIFWTYQRKYFSFRAPNENKTKSTWPHVNLFGQQPIPPYVPRHMNQDLDCGVAERNAISTIRKTIAKFEGLPQEVEAALIKAVSFMNLIYRTKSQRAHFNFNDDFLQKAMNPSAFENFDAFVSSGLLQPKQVQWLEQFINTQVIMRATKIVEQNLDPYDLYSHMIDSLFPEIRKEMDSYLRDEEIFGSNTSYYDGLPIFYHD